MNALNEKSKRNFTNTNKVLKEKVRNANQEDRRINTLLVYAFKMGWEPRVHDVDPGPTSCSVVVFGIEKYVLYCSIH